MANSSAQNDKLRVFLSYSRRDLATANAIADALEQRGIDVLIDRRDLPYGEEWQTELAELIRGADAIVWLVSQASVVSRWCNWELGEVMRLGKRLVPVAMEEMSTRDMPEAIGKVQLLPNEGTFALDRHLDTLKFVLETDGDWIKEHTRLADRAHLWLAKSRPRDLLLRGMELRDAQSWLDNRKPSAPAASAETLELILASRRLIARRRIWIAGTPLAMGLAWLIAYTSFVFLGAQRLPDTNFAMGDILNAQGDVGFDGSYVSCRLQCMFGRFGQPCVGFTYDRSPPTPVSKRTVEDSPTSKWGGKELVVEKARCYLKYSVDFSWRPSEIGSEAADSEILPSLTGQRPQTQRSPYLMRWSRGLSGETVELKELLAKGDVNATFDHRTGRMALNTTAGECQQTCIDLKEKCRGFSFTSLSSRCELFKRVTGILREAGTNQPVFMPATISGCDDPEAAIDPETKQPECPPRGGFAQRTPRD